MEDSKILDISVEDIKILSETNPVLKNLPKLRRQSNNSTCSLANTVDSDNSENLQSCGSVCVYNLQQQLIFNCEFCDLKYGDLDNFRRHLHQAHNLFKLEEEPGKQNAGKKPQSSKVCTVVKKEPLEPPIDLPSTYFTEPLVSCGAVFIFNQEEFHLACGYCDCSKYDNMNAFEKHVRQQHNILEGADNELNVVPKVEVKEEKEFLINEVVKPTEVKVEKKEHLEVGVVDIKQSYSDDEENEDEDENKEGEDDDEETEIDEDDEEFLDEDDEEFLDEDNEDEDGEEDETEDEQNTSKATKRKQQESPSDELSSSSSAKRKSNEEVECGICQKRLKRRSLNYHRKLHLGESAKVFNCQHCDKKFLLKLQLKNHMTIHTGSMPYECDVCQKRFRYKHNATRHKMLHSGEEAKKFQCDQCEKKYFSRFAFEAHIKMHTGFKPFECDICNKRYRHKNGLTTHKKLHMDESANQFNCQHCDKKFLTDFELISHERSHTGEQPFACDACHDRFSNKRSLNIHKLIHLGAAPKYFQCYHCEEIFPCNSDLKQHLRQHSTPFECDLCDNRFATTEELENHVTTHVGEAERLHICVFCNKKFYLESELNIHAISHWSHKCDICFRRFETHDKLDKHKKQHLGEKNVLKFYCQHCSEKFKTSRQFKAHLNTHAAEKPLECKVDGTLQCEQCYKKFKNRSCLKNHLRIHTGETPFECDICHKRFRSHGSYFGHKIRHLGDAGKNAKCEYCDKTYFTNRELRTHVMKYHAAEESKKAKPLEFKAGNRVFNCDHCNKKFEKRKNLHLHQRTHTGEKIYECEICHKSFADMEYLKAHKKRHLGDTAKTKKCGYCDKKFVSNKTVQSHIKKIHTEKETKK